MALSKGLVQQNGSWFAFEGEKFAQGREQALTVLKTEKDFFEKLYQAVVSKIDVHASNIGASIEQGQSELDTDFIEEE